MSRLNRKRVSNLTANSMKNLQTKDRDNIIILCYKTRYFKTVKNSYIEQTEVLRDSSNFVNIQIKLNFDKTLN